MVSGVVARDAISAGLSITHVFADGMTNREGGAGGETGQREGKRFRPVRVVERGRYGAEIDGGIFIAGNRRDRSRQRQRRRVCVRGDVDIYFHRIEAAVPIRDLDGEAVLAAPVVGGSKV